MKQTAPTEATEETERTETAVTSLQLLTIELQVGLSWRPSPREKRTAWR